MASAPASNNDLPFFPPPRDMSRPFDPPPLMLQWLDTPGLTKVRTWDGTEAWVVTRFREARKVLGDQRFSADPTKPGFPEKSAGYKGSIGQDKNIRTMDDPEHGQEKRFLARDFAVTRLNEMRPAIQAKVDSLIDDMLAKGPPAEFFEDFALAIPTMVICEMLGVPYGDRDWFAELSYTCLSSEVDVSQSEAAGKDLYDYIDGLIDLKEREPGNDLMTRLVVEALNPGLKTRKSIVELARLVLIAGHETTANMIALSVAALLHYPDQLALLKADPSLTRNAVEELLRFLSVAHTGRRRAATADIEIGGTLIRAGEGVIIANSAADRDESEFANSFDLDIRRNNAKLNMAFGYGNHQCLGQMLSRVELEIVHNTLWKRIPTLELAIPFEEVPFREDTSVYGVRALPIRW
jgi:Cytochrome P450